MRTCATDLWQGERRKKQLLRLLLMKDLENATSDGRVSAGGSQMILKHDTALEVKGAAAVSLACLVGFRAFGFPSGT